MDADEKNSTMNIPALYQSGLGMGDRDYYLSEESKEIKDASRSTSARSSRWWDTAPSRPTKR